VRVLRGAPWPQFIDLGVDAGLVSILVDSRPTVAVGDIDTDGLADIVVNEYVNIPPALDVLKGRVDWPPIIDLRGALCGDYQVSVTGPIGTLAVRDVTGDGVA